MSWAFATKSLLETLTLLDARTSLLPESWKLISDSFAYSALFLAANLYGANDYCTSGNFIYAMGYLERYSKLLKYVDIEKMFEYTSNTANTWKAHHNLNAPGMLVKPHENDLSDYMPYKTFNVEGLNANLIEIFDSYDFKFNETTIKTIKSHLSRGIPVVGLAYFKYLDNFNNYNGEGILEQACESPRSAE